MHGREVAEYCVFLSSPGDVPAERESVRQYFAELNRVAGSTWRARFQLLDWENQATAGLGQQARRPISANGGHGAINRPYRVGSAEGWR